MPPEILNLSADDGFVAWLSHLGHAVAITTYQANKVVVLGWDGRQMTALPRNFDKPMGLVVDGNRLALATRHDVMLFANAPQLAGDFMPEHPGRYDALIVPRVSYHTGDLNVHEIAFGQAGLWLVNSRFCCLSHLSADHNFVPVWRPRFLSALVPEDRCHLNGMCMIDGEPRYATALGETDSVGGWRPGKATGGVVIDVVKNDVVMRGLAMPHSPRWHDGKLWLLNSGAGELQQFDPATGDVRVVCTLPGYLRGLCFVGDYALVGMSQIRERHIFGGLPVQERFAKLTCGVALVEVRTGQVAGQLAFTSGCTELFDVQVIPNVRRPMLLNLEREEARQAFTAPEIAYWLRPSNEVRDSASG